MKLGGNRIFVELLKKTCYLFRQFIEELNECPQKISKKKLTTSNDSSRCFIDRF